jgi:hypothetical protein
MAELDTSRLTDAEESDHVDIHQRHLIHLQHDAASSRFDLGFQFWKTLGPQPANQPDTGAVLAWNGFDLQHHAEPAEQ